MRCSIMCASAICLFMAGCSMETIDPEDVAMEEASLEGTPDDGLDRLDEEDVPGQLPEWSDLRPRTVENVDPDHPLDAVSRPQPVPWKGFDSLRQDD